MSLVERLVDVLVERIDPSESDGQLNQFAFTLDAAGRPDLATRIRDKIWPTLGDWQPYADLDLAFRRRDFARMRAMVANPLPVYRSLLPRSLAVLGEHEAVIAVIGSSPRASDVRRVVETYAELGDLERITQIASLVPPSTWSADGEREWREDVRSVALQRAGRVREAQEIVTKQIALLIEQRFSPNDRVTQLFKRCAELGMTADAAGLAKAFARRARYRYGGGTEDVQAILVLRAHGAPADAKAAFARLLRAHKKDFVDPFDLYQTYWGTVSELVKVGEFRRAHALVPGLHAARVAKGNVGLFPDEMVTWSLLGDPVLSLTRATEAVKGPYLDEVELEFRDFILYCLAHPLPETPELIAAVERFRTVNR